MMAIFEKDKIKIISESENIDLAKSSISNSLSAVDFNSEEKFFYITIDKVLFSNPVTTIRSVLDAHGFVSNLENVLSCLDSLVFCINAKVSTKDSQSSSPEKVSEYLPCVRFELPQKNRVGEILQSFYDELAKYESRLTGETVLALTSEPEMKSAKVLNKEVEQLKTENSDLREQVQLLTQQLIQERKSLSRASRALDAQQVLPENTKICRVEDVDLKKRIIKVKLSRKVIDIPTHILDRVPEFEARCLVIFDESVETPIGILFFDNEELNNLEKRTAELLYVEGDSFKARDSKRNEFQIKALNAKESETINTLHRGMKILISIANEYVVRFSVIDVKLPEQFKDSIEEQFTVYEIGRNQLVDVKLKDDDSEKY